MSERQIREVAEQEVARVAREVAQQIRDRVPVETGNLRDSVSSDARSVSVAAPYADEVNDGTVDRPGRRFVEMALTAVLGRVR